MTAQAFRRIALAFPGVVEQSHFDHPDFRVSGKIFATLGYPRRGWGMVKLSPKLQKRFVQSGPDTFIPAPGKWGRGGGTLIHLRFAQTGEVRKALIAAWRNTAPGRLTKQVNLE